MSVKIFLDFSNAKVVQIFIGGIYFLKYFDITGYLYLHIYFIISLSLVLKFFFVVKFIVCKVQNIGSDVEPLGVQYFSI